MYTNKLYTLVLNTDAELENHILRISKCIADRTDSYFYVENDADNWTWDPAPKKVVFVYITGSATISIIQDLLSHPERIDLIYKLFLVVPYTQYTTYAFQALYNQILEQFEPISLNPIISHLKKALDKEEHDTVYNTYAKFIIENRLVNPIDTLVPRPTKRTGIASRINQMELTLKLLTEQLNTLKQDISDYENSLN